MEEIHHRELLSDIIFAATQRFRCAQEKSQQASDQTLDSEGWRHKTHPNSPRPSPRRAASGLSREASRDLEYEEYEPEKEGLGAVFGQNEAEGKLDYFSSTAAHCYNVGYQPTRPPPRIARTPADRKEDRQRSRRDKKMLEAEEAEAKEVAKRAELRTRQNEQNSSWFGSATGGTEDWDLASAPEESEDSPVQRLSEIRSIRKLAPPPKRGIGV